MIKYTFKDKYTFNLSFNDFISLTINDTKMYKRDFTDFSELIFRLDTSDIQELFLDNKQLYFNENGDLSNLERPSMYVSYNGINGKGMSARYFYNNNMLYSRSNPIKRREDLENTKVYYYKDDLKNSSNKIEVDIDSERKNEIRRKKIKKLI